MRAVRIAAVVGALLLALGGPGAALASTGQQGGGVRFGPFTLGSGETWHGDLVVIGGPLTIEEDAVVDGDAVVVGGGAEVAGTVDRNLVVVGGRAELDDSAVVGEDLVLVGSTVLRSSGARIGGRIEEPLQDLQGIDFEGFRFDIEGFELGRFDLFREFSFFRGADRPAGGVLLGSLVVGLVRTVVSVVTAIAIGLVLVAILPDHLGRVADSLLAAPLPTLGAGLGTLLGGAFVILLLVLTICGIPLAVIGALALALAGIMGWVALGYLVGRRLLEEGGAEKAGALPAVAGGVFLITLITAAPIGLGPLFSLFAGAWGLGAVVLTRFGTQTYPKGAD